MYFNYQVLFLKLNIGNEINEKDTQYIFAFLNIFAIYLLSHIKVQNLYHKKNKQMLFCKIQTLATVSVV